ncbi:MAG: YdbL family protein, partial [Candidatus Aminicenantes bacterium]|nr:YdbL family protein [Candidatus Aminicenantes bacterium]
VSTPTIRALKRSMRDRFPQLVPFYDSGHIGEGNDGYVVKRNEDDLNLKKRAELRNLVRDENKDREDLYKEVAAALDIDQSQIPRIQKIFAGNWIRKARPGWWVQKPDGSWERKQ